jgi:MFS family permease
MRFFSPRFLFRSDGSRAGGDAKYSHPDISADIKSAKDSVLHPTTRVSMARVVAGWGFGAAFTNVTSGAIYTAFARALGANDFAFGVLAAALPAMSFLQILAAKLVEHSGKRKRQVLIAGLIGRGLWALAATLPLVSQAYPELIGSQHLLAFVIGAILLAGAFQAFSTPAFFSWMADLVPSRVRPTFFASRMRFGTWVAVLTTIVSGLIADHYSSLNVYCILLALAGVCGMLDIAYLIGVREPETNAETNVKPSRTSPPIWEMVSVPLRETAIRRFLLFVSILMFSYGLQGPFLWLHALEYLHLSKTLTGLLLAGVPLVAIASTTRFWGDVLRRYGNRPVMRFASMGIALASVGWLIARPGAWDVLPFLLFASGAMAGALELANQNLITGLSPHVPRSSLAAMFSISAGVSFAVAAWLGGALAQAFVWINNSGLDWFGMPIVNYHMLFLISLALRLFNATFVAPRLHEPEAVSTIATVKEVFPELAQAFAARFTRPLGVRED